MTRIAGYRSRDRDTLQFIEVTGHGAAPSGDLVLMIEPEQMLVVGAVDFTSTSVQRSLSGEWGRIGPPPSVQDMVIPNRDPDHPGSRPITDGSID